MARTNFVKAFRGQRKCQWTDPDNDSWYAKKCGEPRSAAVHDDGHPFTQKPLRCESCGYEIAIGMGYKWVAPRPYPGARSVRRTRHTNCPGWKQSELTSSPHLATIYAAQENADDGIAAIGHPTEGDTEGWGSSLDDVASGFAEEIREAEQSYTESADNMEEGFGHETYQSEELREKADAIAGWADELDGFTVEPYAGMTLDDLDPDDYEQDEAEMQDDINEQEGEWADEQIDTLTELIGANPI